MKVEGLMCFYEQQQEISAFFRSTAEGVLPEFIEPDSDGYPELCRAEQLSHNPSLPFADRITERLFSKPSLSFAALRITLRSSALMIGKLLSIEGNHIEAPNLSLKE